MCASVAGEVVAEGGVVDGHEALIAVDGPQTKIAETQVKADSRFGTGS